MSLIEEIRDLFKYSDEPFLQSLYRSQQEGAYCDVELCVGRDKWTVPVHRVVLAARSLYFQTMFNSDFLERNCSVIVLDPSGEIFTSRKSLDLLVEFLYTGNFSKPPGLQSVVELFRASSLWILENLQRICEYYLAASLSLDNCKDILYEARKYNSDLLVRSCVRFMYSHQDLAEDFSSIVEELSNLKPCNISTNQAKYYLAFHRIPTNTPLNEFIAEIKFPSETETYKKVGVQFQVDAKGCVVITEFSIRLPTWIDFKHLGTRRSQEIIDSVIVCAAAMGESCFFGIANRTGNSEYRFCGILEYHIKTEGWEMIPYIQDSIVSYYRLGSFHPKDLHFFVEQDCQNGPKLKIKSEDRDCWIVRSLEEEAIVVEQILPLERLTSEECRLEFDFHEEWDDDINGENVFDDKCENVFKINDDTFYQFDQTMIKMDVEDNIQEIDLESKSSSDGVTSRFCVPLNGSRSFLVLLKLLRNHSSGLEARIFSLEGGYRTISQPEDRSYHDSEQLHLLADEEAGKIYVIGKLSESGSSEYEYGINIYTIDTDTWTFNYLENASAFDDNKYYTGHFPIFT